jgi:hypothetical protein
MKHWKFSKTLALYGIYGIFCCGINLFAAETAPKRKPVRSVIEIWVWGGPSHLETFDPKPDAGKE